MRPVVNVSAVPDNSALRSVGLAPFLGVLAAAGLTVALVFGVVPGAEHSASPSGLEVTSASAISVN